MGLSANRRMLPIRPVINRLSLAALGLFIGAGIAAAQYQGHVNNAVAQGPVLRSVAVLEWTGEAGKPSASRLIPVAVFHDGSYEDGGLYLARPEPLALNSGTEYQLQQAGLPQSVYDVFSAGQLGSSWIGYGSWKPTPPPPPVHRLKHSEIAVDGNDSSDDRRPHFRKVAPDAGGPGGGAPTQANPPDDPDRPRLSKRPESTPDNSPTGNASTAAATGDMETVTAGGDPDRPHLGHGAKPLPAAPVRLEGTPPALEQMIAVSDAATRTDHSLRYSWATPEEATKMQALLNTIAQQAIAKATPSAKPSAKPAGPKPVTASRRKTTTTHSPATAASAAPPPAHPISQSTLPTKAHASAAHRATAHRKTVAHPPTPITLTDVQFSAFELTYSSGATLVFSARTTGDEKTAKYVTIIAQPDIYGTPKVLFTQVTNGNDLDATPRMRLVDAVDVAGNNRGDLLFELRGNTARQFAIYRVAGGRVDQMIATSSMPIGSGTTEATTEATP